MVIRRFDINEGIQCYLIDYYKTKHEKSIDIFNEIIRILESNNLPIEKISSFSADNASVNFGKYNSVYTKLLEKSDKIIKSGCVCHILHNSVKYTLNKLNFDIESIGVKLYSHFKNSPLKSSKLKTFCNSTGTTYINFLKHSPTRWLTLLPAIDQLLKNWITIKDFFDSTGFDECPQLIKSFIFPLYLQKTQ